VVEKTLKFAAKNGPWWIGRVLAAGWTANQASPTDLTAGGRPHLALPLCLHRCPPPDLQLLLVTRKMGGEMGEGSASLGLLGFTPHSHNAEIPISIDVEQLVSRA